MYTESFIYYRGEYAPQGHYMKLTIPIFLMVMLVVPAYAAFIETVNCNDLLNLDTFTPQTTFNEPAEVCFYGSGFEGSSVDIELHNADHYFSLNADVTNGVITSVHSGDLFSNVPKGVYVIGIVEGFENYEPVIVLGADEVPPPNGEVPEFGALAAGAVLAGAGLYLANRRKVHQ